jgi:hypothetical protein
MYCQLMNGVKKKNDFLIGPSSFGNKLMPSD